MALVIPDLLFPLLAIMALQKIVFETTDKNGSLEKIKTAGMVMAGIFLIAALLYSSLDYKGIGDSNVMANIDRFTQNNKEDTTAFLHCAKARQASTFWRRLITFTFFCRCCICFFYGYW